MVKCEILTKSKSSTFRYYMLYCGNRIKNNSNNNFSHMVDFQLRHSFLAFLGDLLAISSRFLAIFKLF